MRLVSFNIRGGRDPDGRADPARLRAALAALDADVLALQEVDRGQERSGGADQLTIAADACGVAGARHVRSEPALHGPAGASYGLAVVSRYPVRAWHRIELPRWPVPVPWVVGTARSRPHVCCVYDEPRVAVAAVLDGSAPVRTVVTTHLSFLPGVNVVQLRALARAVRDLPGPLVVAGDLNMLGRTPRAVLPGWGVAPGPPTFPAHAPRRRLDRVLVRGSGGPVPRGVAAEHAAVSDHRALSAEI